MTMNTGIARALRRFVGGSAIMLGIVTGLHEMIYNADPELPPRDVDRVVVTPPEGRPYEITDPARVRRIVRLIRSHGNNGVRPRHHGYDMSAWWSVTLHCAAEPPRHAFLAGQTLIISSGENTAMIAIGARDEAEFRRLLRLP